jgi:hypothetical protein
VIGEPIAKPANLAGYLFPFYPGGFIERTRFFSTRWPDTRRKSTINVCIASEKQNEIRFPKTYFFADYGFARGVRPIRCLAAGLICHRAGFKQ